MAEHQPVLGLYVQDAVDRVVYDAFVLQPLLQLESVDLQDCALTQPHDELGLLLAFDHSDRCGETRKGDSLEGLNRGMLTIRFM